MYHYSFQFDLLRLEQFYNVFGRMDNLKGCFPDETFNIEKNIFQ